MRATLIRLSLLLLLGSLAYAALEGILPASWYYSGFVWIPMLTGGITLFILHGLHSRMKEAKSYIRFFMGATSAKLFLYTMIITVVGFVKPAQVIGVALCILLFYLITTAYETVSAFSAVTRKASSTEPKP
ncbi:MAG: hypothetical protein ACKOQY_07570 [Bacteroidota bacterium]